MSLPRWVSITLMILGILLILAGVLLLIFREVKDESGKKKVSSARVWTGVILLVIGVVLTVTFSILSFKSHCTTPIDAFELQNTYADCGGRTGPSCGEYAGQKRLQYNAGGNFFQAVPKYSLTKNPVPIDLGSYRKSEKCFDGKQVYEFVTMPAPTRIQA